MFHSPFEVQMKGITITTTGSVGLDESLDLVAEVGFGNMLPQDSDKPIIKALLSRPLKLPIGGTLKKPKVDMARSRELRQADGSQRTRRRSGW